MKLIYFCLLIISALINADAFQADKITTVKTNRQNAKTDEAARQIIVVQPDFTANADCTNYENEFGHGFGESYKAAKKGDLYRRESAAFIEYAAPGEPLVRYLLKTEKYATLTSDTENHRWFANVANPALLAWEKSLRFEIISEPAIDFNFGGKAEIPKLIKIKVTGETADGGDSDKAIAFLYVAPHLKNLVVKTELIFPKGGRICTLSNISLKSSGKLFTQFAAYRRKQIDKFLTLPKAADVAKIEFGSSLYQRAFFTEKSLLEALPRFAPGGNYRTKMTYQTGTITLKDGTILSWTADGVNSLRLTHNRLERYFLLPPETRRKTKKLQSSEKNRIN